MTSGSKKKLLHLFLVLFCAFITVQCGSSDSVEEARCVPEFLTGGSYSFVVTAVSDECTGGLLESVIPPGPYVMELPSFSELPASTVIDIPFVGEVTMDLSVSENAVQMTTDPPVTTGTIDYAGISVAYEAVVTGVLCPTTAATANLSLQVNITGLTPDYFVTPCTVVLLLKGEL